MALVVETIKENRLQLLEALANSVAYRWVAYFTVRRIQGAMMKKVAPENALIRKLTKEIEKEIKKGDGADANKIKANQIAIARLKELWRQKAKPYFAKRSPILEVIKEFDRRYIPSQLLELGVDVSEESRTVAESIGIKEEEKKE